MRAAYEATVAAEIALARLARSRAAVRPTAPASLTVVVKTFERPAVLRRMLGSLRRVYTGPVIVADDSAEPVSLDDPLVTVLRLPFDSGVGAGRNALIDAVTTDYLWMADDDMVVLPDLDIGRVVAWLDVHAGVDLVGGRVVNLPTGRTADYSAAALYAREGRPRVAEGTLIDGLPVRSKVPNFYVARTEAVRAVRYDDALKRVDHNDFFTAAYGRLVCVQDDALVCLHAHSYFDPHYQAFRMDTAADAAYLARKWGVGGVPQASAGVDAVADAVRSALHRAALQVVADDLGVRIVHEGGPDAEPRAGVRDEDVERLRRALRQLGWSGRTDLTHPLWGGAAVRPVATVDGAPALVGGVRAIVAEPALWAAAPPAPADHPVARGVRWGDRVGWVDEGDAVSAAPLPLGPVMRLSPPGDEIWRAVGAGGRPVDDVVADVLAAHPDAPPDAAQQVRDYLAELTDRGLVTRSFA